MKYIVLALLVLGCQESRSKQAPPTAVASSKQRELCVVSLAMFERFVDTGDPDATPAQLQKLKIALLDRCEQDVWSDVALACMRAAKDPHETFKCWNDLLTKEQRTKASEALGALAPK